MMMKLLPFVAAAAAEKRFLSTAGKARIDTNSNVLFDTAVNDTAGSNALTDSIAIDKGAVYIGGKDTASSITGLTDGAVYVLGMPASVTDAKWKTHSRQIKKKDNSAKEAVTQATLPDCSNKFIETKAGNAAAKSGSDTVGTKTAGGADADLTLNINDTNAGLDDNDKVYLACSNKTATKKPKLLTCGTVYTLSSGANKGGASATYKLKAAGAAAVLKGSATTSHHEGDNSWDAMFFVEVASDTPKVLNICTAKASAARMAAFVSGLIAYALLI